MKQLVTLSALAGILAVCALPGWAQVRIDAAQMAALEAIEGRTEKLKQTANTPKPSAAAGEIARVKLTDVADASVIVIPGGCTKTKEHWFGDSKETIDCFGILLKGAKGSDSFQMNRELGAILVLPIDTIGKATTYLRNITIALGKSQGDPGETVQISELTVLGTEVKLSDITKRADDKGAVKIGGLSIHYKIVKDNATLTWTTRIGIGQ